MNEIERLSTALRTAFPDMGGFSIANLRYTRHIASLLDKLDDRQTRDWLQR